MIPSPTEFGKLNNSPGKQHKHKFKPEHNPKCPLAELCFPKKVGARVKVDVRVRLGILAELSTDFRIGFQIYLINK
jgi:hypothetical protein